MLPLRNSIIIADELSSFQKESNRKLTECQTKEIPKSIGLNLMQQNLAIREDLFKKYTHCS
ncbi:MAG: hypothetical protein ACI8XX_000033 [Polaribacter sp.]|jgi:hypothetical protein